MTFKTNTVYRLKDPNRYDDENGEGFDHVETFGDCDGMFITDCWIVNAQGSVHPGYDESPVPISFNDVEESEITASNGEKKRNTMMWR